MFKNYPRLSAENLALNNIKSVDELYIGMARKAKDAWVNDLEFTFQLKYQIPPQPTGPFDDGRNRHKQVWPISLPWEGDDGKVAIQNSMYLAPTHVARFLLHWTSLVMKRSWLGSIKSAGRSPACVVNDAGEVWAFSWPDAAGVSAREQLAPANFASDVSVGSDGGVWAISTKPRPGGFAICYLANGATKEWVELKEPAGATKIAVAPDGRAFTVNSIGTVWALSRPDAAGQYSATQLSDPNFAHDISVGSNGSVWVLRNKQGQRGAAIHYLGEKGWIELTDIYISAKKKAAVLPMNIAAKPHGGLYFTNGKDMMVWSVAAPHKPGAAAGRRLRDPFAADSVGAGSDGSVWVNVSGRFAIFYFAAATNGWVEIKESAHATKIAVM